MSEPSPPATDDSGEPTKEPFVPPVGVTLSLALSPILALAFGLSFFDDHLGHVLRLGIVGGMSGAALAA